MGLDQKHRCLDCSHVFLVRGFIDADLRRFGKTAQCPRCESWRTGNARTISLQKPMTQGRMLEPPSDAQLGYIKALGGDPGTVRNKGEASEVIARLKKEKGR